MVWLIYVHSSIQSRTFKSYKELIAEYESGELHPADLKPALSNSLNKIIHQLCQVKHDYNICLINLSAFMCTKYKSFLFFCSSFLVCCISSMIFLDYAQPVREHFRKDSNAKELLKRVKVSLVLNLKYFIQSFGFHTYTLNLILVCRLTESP